MASQVQHTPLSNQHSRTTADHRITRRRYEELTSIDFAHLRRSLPDPGTHPALRATASTTALPKTTTIARTAGLRRPRSIADARHHILKRQQQEDARRDSGLAPSFVTMQSDSSKPQSAGGSSTVQHVPSIIVHRDTHNSPKNETSQTTNPDTLRLLNGQSNSTSSNQPFEGIQTDIPTGTFEDPFSSEQLSFSNRGSVLWSGEKAKAWFGRSSSTKSFLTPKQKDTSDNSSGRAMSEKAMSADDTRLSERVRSMYERGDEKPLVPPAPMETETEKPLLQTDTSNDTLGELPQFTTSPRLAYSASASTKPSSRPQSMTSHRRSYISKEPTELAGGMEDWKDVNVEDVDRYGFIRQLKRLSSGESMTVISKPGSPNPSHTEPLSSSNGSPETSFRVPRLPAAMLSSQRLSASNGGSGSRPISRASANRGPGSIRSTRSRASHASSTANRGRKWANEAIDMMTLQPGSALVPAHTEDTDSPKKAAVERRREGKWAAMARTERNTVTSHSESKGSGKHIGGGSRFTFDTSSEKVISRTWKGIPDRWRSEAWYAFLTTSAKRQQRQAFVQDDVLIEKFYSYQDHFCADDVQIDMDVPRTIGGHIMFRRRYRGGQRLLFRVLRALSLHFPAIGYVQGMASIAATLLCYYDEETAFVMAVRLWECRGVAYLYEEGFAKLMDVIQKFDQSWLSRLPVKKTLEDMGVSSTSFLTKWYLTLFGYSIPFPAQLRVWDVYMLLGDGSGMGGGGPSANFDILHGVAAALLDGLQEVLLGADFENAMKALTQPVPVGKEDVLMRIAQKEYKVYRSKMKK